MPHLHLSISSSCLIYPTTCTPKLSTWKSVNTIGAIVFLFSKAGDSTLPSHLFYLGEYILYTLLALFLVEHSIVTVSIASLISYHAPHCSWLYELPLGSFSFLLGKQRLLLILCWHYIRMCTVACRCTVDFLVTTWYSNDIASCVAHNMS